MIPKINFTYPIFILVILASFSCTKKFDEINKDPNRPTSVYPGPLLGQMQYKFITAALKGAKNNNHELMQVTAPRESVNGGTHRYQLNNSAGTDIWNEFYINMNDLEDLISIADKTNEPNYKTIALIYKAWSYSILTDCFKDIPFKETAKAVEGNYKPAFTNQKEIYTQILEDLADANILLTDAQGLSFGGDLVYKTAATPKSVGILKWKKFNNSLRLRLLLRILKRDGELNVRQQINNILADPNLYPVFTSTSDDAIFQFPGVNPYFNPFYNARTLNWRSLDYYTNFFLKQLNATEDPRRAIWATQVSIDGKMVYQGIQSGYESTVQHIVDKNSSYSDALKTAPNLGIMMTYSELEFIKAELALKGFATGNNPKAHYENGINASMLQWKVTAPTNFLSKTEIAYKSDTTEDGQMSQIMLQKYYALYFTDYQSWFEKRRTGYPVLPRGNGIPATNQFPSRLLYPTYLQSLNSDNLKQATEQMGGDMSSVKAWWE